jgi:F-type H+-transporting ATPase subunit delta
MSKASYRDIAEATYALIRSGADESATVEALAHYLVEERRTKELDKIMRELQKLRAEQEGVTEVVASSAFALSESAQQEIKQLFGGKKVKLVQEIDTSLVGGVRLRTLEDLVDLSVRGRLQQLKNNIV